jgi:hypothetical protein
MPLSSNPEKRAAQRTTRSLLRGADVAELAELALRSGASFCSEYAPCASRLLARWSPGRRLASFYSAPVVPSTHPPVRWCLLLSQIGVSRKPNPRPSDSRTIGRLRQRVRAAPVRLMRLARIGNADGKTSAEDANARVRGVGVALRACLRFAECGRRAGRAAAASA